MRKDMFKPVSHLLIECCAMIALIGIQFTVALSQSKSQSVLSFDYEDYETKSPPNKTTSSLTDSNLTLVGEWPWGECRAVAIKDNLAFIGNGKLVQVFDLSNPDTLTIVAEYNAGGLVLDIKIRDTLAFVCAAGGLQIIDIANTVAINQLSYLRMNPAYEVVPTDSFAYVLQLRVPPIINVVDITDPRNPRVRSQTLTGADWPVTITVSKDRFIYATGYNFPYFTIIDARNPDSLAHYDQGLGTQCVSVSDTVLYIGRGGGLWTFSIADPTTIVKLDSNYTGFQILERIISDGEHYVYASGDSGVEVFDVSDPSHITLAGRFHAMSTGTLSLGEDGQMLMVTTSSGFAVINTTRVDSMYLEASFMTGGQSQRYYYARSVCLRSNGETRLVDS